MVLKEAVDITVLSDWAGWIVACIVASFWVVREVLSAREKRAASRNTDASTLKMQLDMLNEAAGARLRELSAIQQVLNADPMPDPQALAALETSPDTVGGYVYQHVKSRSEARAQLPSTINRLLAIQTRRVQMEGEIALGIETSRDGVAELRISLDEVSTDVNKLIKILVDSPRIFVQAEEPADSNNGDLWFPVPGSSTQALEEQP